MNFQICLGGNGVCPDVKKSDFPICLGGSGAFPDFRKRNLQICLGGSWTHRIPYIGKFPYLWSMSVSQEKRIAKPNSNLKVSWRESIRGDTTGNENMRNVERRAKSSGVNSSSARTVTETATAYATVI